MLMPRFYPKGSDCIGLERAPGIGIKLRSRAGDLMGSQG